MKGVIRVSTGGIAFPFGEKPQGRPVSITEWWRKSRARHRKTPRNSCPLPTKVCRLLAPSSICRASHDGKGSLFPHTGEYPVRQISRDAGGTAVVAGFQRVFGPGQRCSREPAQTLPSKQEDTTAIRRTPENAGSRSDCKRIRKPPKACTCWCDAITSRYQTSQRGHHRRSEPHCSVGPAGRCRCRLMPGVLSFGQNIMTGIIDVQRLGTGSNGHRA